MSTDTNVAQMRLPHGSQVFEEASGQHRLVLVPEFGKNEKRFVAYVANSDETYERLIGGLGPDNTSGPFTNPFTNETNWVKRCQVGYIIGKHTFHKGDQNNTPRELRLRPLPALNGKIVKLLRGENDYFCIIGPVKEDEKNPSSTDGWKFYKGPIEQMKEVEIISATVHLDGGTVIVETVDGVLFIPSPYKAEKKTWKGEEDLTQYYFSCYQGFLNHDDHLVLLKKPGHTVFSGID